MVRLTPDEITKMAAAGVRMEWKDIQYTVVGQMDQPAYQEPPRTHESYLEKMLRDRLRWDRNDDLFVEKPLAPGIKFMAVTQLDDNTVIVFLVCNGNALQLTDPWKIFPSDALITQIRLLEN